MKDEEEEEEEGKGWYRTVDKSWHRHVDDHFVGGEEYRRNACARLRRADHLKGRLVNVGNEERLGKNIPLIHTTLDESVLSNHDRVTFYETLNEEVAYFVSCYERAKPISLKSFFMDEAHATSEWLVAMIEYDILMKFLHSNINLEDIRKQRDSINAIRNELHAVMHHPCFSSRNMTPTRILRLSEKHETWTKWQHASFSGVMKEYSRQCHDNSEDRRTLYCTYESSIVFIYNEERERHKKPVEPISDLKSVCKKYARELKNDPAFLEYVQGKANDRDKRNDSVSDSKRRLEEKKKEEEEEEEEEKRKRVRSMEIQRARIEEERRRLSERSSKRPKSILSSLSKKTKKKKKKDGKRGKEENGKRASSSNEFDSLLRERTHSKKTTPPPPPSPSLERSLATTTTTTTTTEESATNDSEENERVNKKKKRKRKSSSSAAIEEFLKYEALRNDAVNRPLLKNSSNASEAEISAKKTKKKSGGVLKFFRGSSSSRNADIMGPLVEAGEEREEEEEKKIAEGREEMVHKKRKQRFNTTTTTMDAKAVASVLKATSSKTPSTKRIEGNSASKT